jgi:hypothetical protein
MLRLSGVPLCRRQWSLDVIAAEFRMTRDSGELVNFMHIEKNAGTTMRSILRMNYNSNEYFGAPPLGRVSCTGEAKTINSPDQDIFEVSSEIQNQQHRLACVAASLPFGIDKYLDRPVAYFTFLREPVERCISTWYFAFQNRSRSGLWSILEQYDFDLLRILGDGVAYQFTNDQVRMIAGISSPRPTACDFRSAREIIAERFVLAGAVTAFDRCLQVLAPRFGWQKTSYSPLNVGVKSDHSLLPTGAENHFREANDLDIRLYEWVVQTYLPRRLA